MSDSLKWLFALDDRMSAGAAKIADQLERLDGVMGQAEKASKKLDKNLGATKPLKDHEKALGAVEKQTQKTGGAWEKAHAVLGSVKHGFDLAKSAASTLGSTMGGVIRQMAGLETLNTSLELMLGNAEAVRGLRDEAARVGRVLGKGTEETMREFQKLLASGFSAVEVPVVFQALGDVSALGGNADALLGLFEKSRTLDRIKRADLESMARAAGVDLSVITDRIAGELRVSQATVRDMLRSEQGIDPTVGILGVLDGVQAKLGGPIGTGAARMADTLDGQLNLLRSSWSNFAAAVDTSGGGLELVKDVLKQLNQLLDPASESGQRLVGIFEGLDRALKNLFSRWDGEGGLDRLIDDFNALLTRIEELVTTLGKITGSVGEAILKPAGDRDMSAGARVAQIGGKTAAYAGMGAVMGSVIPGIGTLVGAGVGGGVGLTVGALEHLLGTDIPWLAEGGMVTQPTLAMIGEAGPEVVVPLHKLSQFGGGGSVLVNLTQNITPTPEMDERQLADVAAREARRELSDFFTGFAHEAGVAA